MSKRREIETLEIEKIVEKLCLKSNIILRADVLRALKKVCKNETKNPVAKKMLQLLVDNAKIAEKEKIAICQDTGLVTVFIEMGDKVIIRGGNIVDAVNKGVKEAYQKGYFRKSIVIDPIYRVNTGTNTPCIVHLDVVKGNKCKIIVMPKGFGSENKGRISMMNPTSSIETIEQFCVETVKIAGPDACPPYVIGIGLGGTMDFAALLSKRALLRPINLYNSSKHIAKMEKSLEKKINDLKIGIMGLGGISTVLGVNIETASTHIAGLPVAVSISCHALRSASAEI
ncbi:MAG: fumarate hydratase [Candidatus Omnitrophota bacterium]|nr:fumarate hydratase [Candidatus Omnitrophota bacterium]MBU1895099.1 fumarate hydratase [Candidatus Omnitrophota bacterium]